MVDFDRPHYLIRALTLYLPPILMHYLLVKNLPLPLIWGVIEVVVEVEVVGAEALEVVTKGSVVVNKGIMVKDAVFISALTVTVKIIQLNLLGVVWKTLGSPS